MQTQNVTCATPAPTPVLVSVGRFKFVGDRDNGIQCIYCATGKRAGEFVVAHIHNRIFKRNRPEGWRDQDRDRLSYVQTHAGYIALINGLTGPV